MILPFVEPGPGGDDDHARHVRQARPGQVEGFGEPPRGASGRILVRAVRLHDLPGGRDAGVLSRGGLVLDPLLQHLEYPTLLG